MNCFKNKIITKTGIDIFYDEEALHIEKISLYRNVWESNRAKIHKGSKEKIISSNICGTLDATTPLKFYGTNYLTLYTHKQQTNTFNLLRNFYVIRSLQ